MERQHNGFFKIKSFDEPYHDYKNEFRMGVIYGSHAGPQNSRYRKRKKMIRIMTEISGLGALILITLAYAQSLFA